MNMEILLSFCTAIGTSSLINYFVQRHFKRKDVFEEKNELEQKEMLARIDAGLETIRLLAYCRMSEEIERLLTKGYATPSERRILDEMFRNYKAHGWNGDMDARLEKVYQLRTDQRK